MILQYTHIRNISNMFELRTADGFKEWFIKRYGLTGKQWRAFDEDGSFNNLNIDCDEDVINAWFDEMADGYWIVIYDERNCGSFNIYQIELPEILENKRIQETFERINGKRLKRYRVEEKK